MPVTKMSVEKVFGTGTAKDGDAAHNEAIDWKAKEFALVLLEHTPAGADLQAALRKVREAVWTAKSAIVTEGSV